MFPFGFLTVLFLIRVTQASSKQALPVPVPFTKTLKVYWGWNVPKLGTTEMQLVEEVSWREMVCKVTVAPEALVTVTAETRSDSWSECIMGKNEQNCSYGMSVPQRYTDVSAHHWLVVLFGLGVLGVWVLFPCNFSVASFWWACILSVWSAGFVLLISFFFEVRKLISLIVSVVLISIWSFSSRLFRTPFYYGWRARAYPWVLLENLD